MDPQESQTPGGIVHTYQKYDPVHFPSPTAPPPDMVSPFDEPPAPVRRRATSSPRNNSRTPSASTRRRSPDSGRASTPFATCSSNVSGRSSPRTRRSTSASSRRSTFRDAAKKLTPPAKLAEPYRKAVKEEQLHDLEGLYFRVGNDRDQFALGLVLVVGLLGEKYQVDELAAKYEFTGREKMDVPKALEVKEELEEIDRLLKQLEEAKKTAQLAIIDMEELSEVRRTGRHGATRTHFSSRSKTTSASRPRSRGWRATAKESTGSPRRRCGCSSRRCSPKSSPTCRRRAPADTRTRCSARARSNRRRPRPTSSATPSRRWTSPRAWSTHSFASGPGLPVRMRPDDIVIHRTRVTPEGRDVRAARHVAGRCATTSST